MELKKGHTKNIRNNAHSPIQVNEKIHTKIRHLAYQNKYHIRK
jgi:hypothetical protein